MAPSSTHHMEDRKRRRIVGGHGTTLLAALGFEERIRGGHRIFKRNDIDEIVTLQPRGSKAKTYQVKQVRQLINKHRLASHGDE